MKLFILYAQRKEDYEGQYALEALACMSEVDHDTNPSYLSDAKQQNMEGGEFAAVEVVELEVDEAAVRAQLFPARFAIKADVQPLTER